MARLGARAYYKLNNYAVRVGVNGNKYVSLKTVRNDGVNLSYKNSKTGRVIAFNLPVELTCKHDCECYSKKNCYACGGCYQFTLNQALYSENLVYFLTHSNAEFVQAISEKIRRAKSRILFRWFTCGDIPNKRFLSCMVEIAKENPSITFWTYTKKYAIVNKWIAENGELPENLTIVFSHWMNDDGTYYTMENPHEMPTSEFIPMGKEDLLNTVTHICPCSDPNSKEHCETCKTPCYSLKKGESMALVEHSTARTKERDKAIKEAKESGKLKDINLIEFLKSWDK
jgi:hypothetical protein